MFNDKVYGQRIQLHDNTTVTFYYKSNEVISQGKNQQMHKINFAEAHPQTHIPPLQPPRKKTKCNPPAGSPVTVDPTATSTTQQMQHYMHLHTHLMAQLTALTKAAPIMHNQSTQTDDQLRIDLVKIDDGMHTGQNINIEIQSPTE